MTINLPTANEAPTLMPGTPDLLQQLMGAEPTVADIATQLEGFAPIAAKLIALANSAWSSPINPIATVSDACSRLGLDIVKSLSIALAYGGAFESAKCGAFDPLRYWCTSLLTAEIAEREAADFALDPSTARTAGLLHNIGLLWLADHHPDRTHRVLEPHPEEPPKALAVRLQEEFGVNYTTVGAHLLAAWDMPAILVDAVAQRAGDSGDSSDSGDNARMALLIQTSAELASAVYQHEQATGPACADGLLSDSWAFASTRVEPIKSMAEALFQQ